MPCACLLQQAHRRTCSSLPTYPSWPVLPMPENPCNSSLIDLLSQLILGFKIFAVDAPLPASFDGSNLTGSAEVPNRCAIDAQHFRRLPCGDENHWRTPISVGAVCFLQDQIAPLPKWELWERLRVDNKQ